MVLGIVTDDYTVGDIACDIYSMVATVFRDKEALTMANDINRIFMIGRLTKDPDLKYTQGGTSVCNFSIANNRTYTSQNEKKESVSYFNCVAWGKTGEVIAQYLKKGKRVALEGRLEQKAWQDTEGKPHQKVEIVVENFQFIDPAEKRDGGNIAEQIKDTFDGSYAAPDFNDEDIPF